MALGTPVASTPVYSGVGNLLANVYPSGITAADAVVLFVAQKPSTANGGGVTTPAGFTLQGSKLAAGGYGTTTTDDVGNTNLWVFTKDTVDGTEGGTTLNVTLSGTSASWGVLVHVPTNAGPMTYAVATAEQSTTPTSPLTVLMDSDQGFSARDMAIWAMSIPTDADTPSLFSNHGITATGVTFGTAVELREPDTTINRDAGGFVAYAPISSGTSSGAPTVTADLTGTLTNVRGPLVMIRLRESSTDGDLNSTLGAVTASSAGGVRVTGDAANTLGAVTSSAAGTVRVTGAATNTLGGLAASSAGGVRATGALSQSLGAVTASAAGGVRVTGTASNTLGGVSLTAAGTVVASLNGTLTATLGAITGVSAGTVRVTGALAKTLGAVTASSAATVRVTGVAASTLGAVTAASAGAVRATGALSATLGEMQSAADGGVQVKAALSATLGELTLVAQLEFVTVGAADITLGGLTLAAAGTVSNENRGTLTATLGALTLTAEGNLFTVIPNPDRTARVRASSRVFTAKKVQGQYMLNVGPDGRRWAPHSPGADLDYIENWAEWLTDGETIAISQWTATAGITLTNNTVLNGTTAVIWAAGGVDGSVYVLTNTITTTEGRIDSRTITLRCRPQ